MTARIIPNPASRDAATAHSDPVSGTASAAPFIPSAAALARLKKEQFFWGDIYDGTIDDLIAAGLLLPSQVPGIPGNPKTQATYDENGQVTRKSSVKQCLSVRLTRRGHAEVRVSLDEEEEENRRQQRADQQERERLAKVAKHRIDRMPRTHGDYRGGSSSFARMVLESILLQAAETTNHGFRYGDDEQAELLALSQKMLRVLSKGTTLFDASIQSAALVADRSTIAQADGGFQQMLRSIVPAEGSHHA